MSSFFRNLFGRKPRSALALGVFGKHPGWDDHVDETGESRRLADVRRVLYVEGIGRNIDSGDWDRLKPDGRFDFGHVFVWLRPEGLIAGRMWASSDSKGRDRYPLIAALDCGPMPLDWVLAQGLPRLEKLEQACRAARSAEEVMAALQASRAELTSVVPSAPATQPAPARSALSQLAAAPELAAGEGGLVSLMYHLHKRMAGYFPAIAADGRRGGRAAQLGPGHFRAPSCATSAPDALALWAGFLGEFMTPRTPALLVTTTNVEHGWIDVILGEPTVAELFCLRASRKGMPLASDAPYRGDEAFTGRVNQLIARAKSAAGTG